MKRPVTLKCPAHMRWGIWLMRLRPRRRRVPIARCRPLVRR